jgi:hypothetical protein
MSVVVLLDDSMHDSVDDSVDEMVDDSAGDPPEGIMAGNGMNAMMMYQNRSCGYLMEDVVMMKELKHSGFEREQVPSFCRDTFAPSDSFSVVE